MPQSGRERGHGEMASPAGLFDIGKEKVEANKPTMYPARRPGGHRVRRPEHNNK
jgi:hypothetical protein